MIKKFLLFTTLFTAACFSPALYAFGPTELLVDLNSDTGTSTTPTSGDLRYCLNTANATPGSYNIIFNLAPNFETITLTNILPILNVSDSASTITIDGSNSGGDPITINGGGAFPGFFAQQGIVDLSNMTLLNTRSRGGNGGAGGGGGGAGLGGGLFINEANVRISNLTFRGTLASGGNGNTVARTGGGGGGMFNSTGGASQINSGGGGGGGIGGLGGNAVNNVNTVNGGGGGGGIAPGGSGGNGFSNPPLAAPTPGAPGGAIGSSGTGGAGGGGIAAGQPGGAIGGGGGGGGSNGTDAGSGGGGGGIAGNNGVNGVSNTSGGAGGGGGFGGGGGGAGGRGATANGGTGGFGGGGGGGSALGGNGNSGGFGGGGGSGEVNGGNGGFGGGGGSGTIGGVGGVGGGSGTNAGGGGGAALGGAIFVNSSTAYGGGGGKLTVTGPLSIVNPSLQVGVGVNNGVGAVNGIFVTSSSTNPLTFNPPVSTTITSSNAIGDDSPFTLPGGTYQAGTGTGAILLKSGAGTLSITNSNTYSGGTQLQNGVLQVNNSGALGLNTSPLTFTGDGTLRAGTGLSFPYPTIINSGFVGSLDSNNFTLTMNGIISGAGGINKVGLGFVNLTNTGNSYTGGTKVSVGSLIVMTSTLPVASSQPSVNILSPGRLIFSNDADGTYGGDIVINGILLNGSDDISLVLGGQLSGNGLIQMESVGLMQLTVTSAFTGNMEIAVGEINLFENTTQNYSGNVLMNTFGALSKSGLADLTMSGAITGPGQLRVDAGKLILTSPNNTYTGGSFVNPSATLQGDSNSLRGTITMASGGGTVIFDQNISGIFTGVLVGPTASDVLIKQGNGILVFNTSQTSFQGITNIQQGTLDLNTGIGGTVNVLGTGILSGNGQIFGNLNVRSGGTISPGNSIGTISVFGNYTQETNSTYFVEINGSGQSDLITVTGTANVAGTVVVSPLNGVISPSITYTILHANGGVSGRYDSVVSNNPLIVPTLFYTDTDVLLKIASAFSVIADTNNEEQVAAQLDGANNTIPQLQAIINEIISLGDSPATIGQARHALDQLSGQQYTVLLTAAELTGTQFIRRLYDPLRSIVTNYPCWDCCCNPCDCSPSFNAWIESGGGQSNIQGSRNTRGIKASGYEVTVGAQGTQCNWTAGVAVSYAHDEIKYKVGGHGNHRTWLGGLYGLYRPQNFYVLGDLAFGYSHDTIKRPIHIGRLNYKAHSKPKLYQTIGYLESGYDLCAMSFLIQPFIGLEVAHYNAYSVKESGAFPINLNISGKNYTQSYSRIGLHATTTKIACLSMSFDLAWKYRLTSLRNSVIAQFQSFGDKMRITGVPSGRNSLDYAATISKDICNQWKLYVEVSGEKWSDASSYNVLGGVNYSW